MTSVKRVVRAVDGFDFSMKVLNRRPPFRQVPEAYSVIAEDLAYGFFYSSDVILGNFKEFDTQFAGEGAEIALELSADGKTITLKFNNHTIVMKSRSSEWCDTNIRQVKRVMTEYDLDELRCKYLSTINIFNQLIYSKIIQK